MRMIMDLKGRHKGVSHVLLTHHRVEVVPVLVMRVMMLLLLMMIMMMMMTTPPQSSRS